MKHIANPVRFFALALVLALSLIACTPAHPPVPRTAPAPNVPPSSAPDVRSTHTSTETASEPTTPAPPETGSDGLTLDERLSRADELARGYFYDEALELLRAHPTASDRIDGEIARIEALQSALVPYEGKYYHVFFHSLILDTDKAFDGVGHSADGYNLWMTTRGEFERMLPQMLERGYVLCDLRQIFDVDDSGRVTEKPLLLPEGRMPLILSIDDVNYYEYMKGDGFAKRLDLNAEGQVITIVEEDGREIETFDGDVMPILDRFVAEHPEFSYRGAKGIIAVTGFEGLLGYRVNDTEHYTAQERVEMGDRVHRVVARLKETGWRFASHSYSHNGYFRDASITLEQLAQDTARWKEEIQPYLGEVEIFISPFGMALNQRDPRFLHLVDQGFWIYCPVGGMSTYIFDHAVIQNRLNLDGLVMLGYPERVERFFDVRSVLDPARPPLRK